MIILAIEATNVSHLHIIALNAPFNPNMSKKYDHIPATEAYIFSDRSPERIFADGQIQGLFHYSH
jgi:hypothetical protein